MPFPHAGCGNQSLGQSTDASVVLAISQANFHLIYITDSDLVNETETEPEMETLAGPSRRARAKRGQTETNVEEGGFLRGCNAIVSPAHLLLRSLLPRICCLPVF